MKKTIPFLILLWCFSSCVPQPEPIHYGSDPCDFCKMNIVDTQYAAELVSSKGKVFKFDAIECMVHYLHENQQTAFAYQLVNCYDQPKILQGVEEVRFLKCPALASPMGAFLSAFSKSEEARKVQAAKGGVLYSWSELLHQYNRHDETFDF